MEIKYAAKLDEDGYLDRACPGPECMSSFKVLAEDWRDKVRAEQCFCPICRFDAPKTNSWATPEQVAEARSHLRRAIHEEVGKIFKTAAEKFNRSQPPKGIISLSMSYKPGSKPVLMTAAATAVMRLKSECEACHCRYSSIQTAFFCPACGHNNAASTFDRSVDIIRTTVENLDVIERALAEVTDADQAKDSTRQILENSMDKLVGSFQRFAEARYDALPHRASLEQPRKNAFQNLSASKDLWHAANGTTYEDMLAPSEFSDLERYFQQRHLLSHKEGFVDQSYVDNSGDHRYTVDQRLVIRKEDVLGLAKLVEKLASELRKRP